MLQSLRSCPLAILTVCTALFLASPSATATGNTKSTDPILGKWQYINGVPGIVRTKKPIRLVFTYRASSQSGYVSGNGGCNNVGRRMRFDDDSIILEGEMWATRMMCGYELYVTEQIVMRLLTHDTGWSVSGSRLTLHDADGQLFATFKRVDQ